MSAARDTGPVAVLGASGFVGSHVVMSLTERGVDVRPVRAPRLDATSRTAEGLMIELSRPDVVAETERLRAELADAVAVVNAAGLAHATGAGDDLFGANALLPAVVAEAAPAGIRLVHVSSAAVQGRMDPLDETSQRAPFSPYSTSKALGEELAGSRAGTVCFRPTSVAGRGEGPTPQVLVENVADAVAHVALMQQAPPGIVLQPWEGLTVGGLARDFGGREPRHVWPWLARLVVLLMGGVGAVFSPAAGVARRLEMLWFGQRQVAGWLTTTGWSAPMGRQRWKDMM
jgi:UDP-glucose 4-epimerase